MGRLRRRIHLQTLLPETADAQLAAGGDDVVSTYKDGGYYIMYGTSQATPMVSGVAAVALSINPKLTNTEFTKLLTRTAEDLGDGGYDVRFGYGLVEEAALIEAIMKNIDYYVSPVNIFDGEASVLIKNNTGERLDCISLFAGYKYNRLAHTAITPVVLPAGAETVIRTKGATVHFLWSMEGMAPLADKR